MVAVEDADEGLMHFHLDHLGTPRLITDAWGNTVATHDYAPFGFEVSNPLADSVTKKFTGHERDGGDNPGTKYDLDSDLKSVTPADEMCRGLEAPVHRENVGIPGGLSRLSGCGRSPGSWCRSPLGVADLRSRHARYYSSWQSRFLSVDPAPGDPKNPQSWNRYAYVLGNPVKYVDPFGEIWKIFSKSDDDIKTVLDQVSQKTGLILVVEDGAVKVKGLRAGKGGKTAGSAAARSIVLEAIISDSTFSLNIVRGNKGVEAGEATGSKMTLDMADIESQKSDGPNLMTFDAGMVTLHEMFHSVRGTKDISILDQFFGSSTETGATVDAVNAIRRTLGLPLREQYRPLTSSGDERMLAFEGGVIYFTNR